MDANNSPTAFTDEDFKKFQDDIDFMWDIDAIQMSPEKAWRLKRRLECAEIAIAHLLVVAQDDRESVEYSAGVADEAEVALDDWRKFAGKSPVVRTK